jgi:RNA-directed DNA polymerase
MSARRQNNQLEMALSAGPKGEAPKTPMEGVEALVTKGGDESPGGTEQLMEEVCERENLKEALRRVRANGGSPGVDGMRVEELGDYLKDNWPKIREQLLSGTYQPQPVRRVEIAKPDGGTRKLGIPTVLDRFVQQAVLAVLQGRWDRTFCEQSYGFRPKRSAHQAVAKAQEYLAEGNRWVVDIDLEKFFDRVNHDMLMGRVAKRVVDKRLLKLIRALLNAGVMENGLVGPTDEGTPQGGPLSPLLSNLVLDDLDRELERRGHRFVRYADDCNIYVRSERAGKRVMESVSAFITNKLKLKVNGEKSAVGRPWERKFLGFSFTKGSRPLRRIAPKAVERFKKRVRELTRRTRGVSLERRAADLAVYLRGWRGYFGYSQSLTFLKDLDAWVRRRLRAAIWKQWKHGLARMRELRKRGVSHRLSRMAGYSARGPWSMSLHSALNIALPPNYFRSLGIPSLAGAT